MFSGVTTVCVFRTALKETSQPTRPRDEKEMITDESVPLNVPEGIKQAEALKEWVTRKQIFFDVVITSSAVAAKQTADIVLGKKHIYVENNDWREVDIGSFEGKSALFIKQEYEKYHPGEIAPVDANECLYYAWPEMEGEEKKIFEPLKTTFKKRISSAFHDLAKTYQGKTVAVFTHCEPIREAILIAKGTESFFSTSFGQKIVQLLPDTPTDYSIDTAITLPMLKPDHASAIKLQINDMGEILLVDTNRIISRI